VRHETFPLTRNICVVFVAIFFFGATSLRAQWTQVWGDDFNGSANTTYNHSLWSNEVKQNTGNVWGDGTIQSTSDSLSNAYLDGNGNLVIAMTYNPHPGTGQTAYTSARLHGLPTSGLGPYGRFDARIQNPSSLGMGAAFWALGADNATSGVPWPWCGELDMMEIQSKTSQHNGSTIHGGETDSQTYYEYSGVSATVDLTGGSNFDNGFHVFTTQWAPYHLQYFLDGVLYGDVSLANLGVTDQWDMNQPIGLILSSGVGGNGGTPNGTGFPSNMLVDYIHYSQWSDGAPAPVTGLTATATNSNAVSLSWTASSTPNVTYSVYASKTLGVAPGLATLVVQGVTGTSYVSSALQPSTTYYYTVVSSNWGGESSPANTTVTTKAPGKSTGIQLSAGGYAVGTYATSNFVLGGNTNYHYNVAVDTSAVTNPAPQLVYDTERWGPAAWTITGLNPGAGYNVRLHFVEFAHASAGLRNFNVSINSEQVLNNFDIYAIAGAQNKAITEDFFTLADENGIIEIETTLGTTSVTDLNPTINAIEILPATGSNPVGAAPGTTTDLAIASGSTTAIGTFMADEDFNGGDTATTSQTISTAGVANAAPAAVYQSQRYTPFTYVLKGLIADAAYTINLHFAETYWTAAGKRIFNVAINGTQIITGLDVYATVGGNKALVKQFTANADRYGQIIVQLIYDGADQPFINGIEATETTNSCTAAPSAPGGLVASAASSSAIGLSWSGVSAPAGCAGLTYNVYGSTTNGFTPAAVNMIASGLTSTNYTNSNLAASTTYYYKVEAADSAGASAASAQAQATTNSSGGGGMDFIAIASGGPAQSNAGGGDASFVADEDVSGGGAGASTTNAINLTQPGANAAPMGVYQHERDGVMTYTIPGMSPASQHTVLLHFSELYWNTAGKRVFNVAINGTTVLSNFDIYATVGRYAALVEQFAATANSSGQIVIRYTSGTADQPEAAGIEIR
jgi:trimeric autotransporter adhesin